MINPPSPGPITFQQFGPVLNLLESRAGDEETVDVGFVKSGCYGGKGEGRLEFLESRSEEDA